MTITRCIRNREFQPKVQFVNDNKESLSSGPPARPGRCGTACATAVKHEFVAGNTESSRGPGQHRAGTTAQFEHTAACSAVKVVMMRLARYLVASGLPGKRHRVEPAFSQQRFDIAVYGSDAQRLVVALCGRQCFFGRERAIRFDERFSYRLLLARVAGNRLRHTP
jgi:hypothetical protein